MKGLEVNVSNYLDSFKTNGQTTYQGQQNAGSWEAKNVSQPAAQQSNESWAAYTTRINSYNHTKNGG